jgi:hypothetical protein
LEYNCVDISQLFYMCYISRTPNLPPLDRRHDIREARILRSSSLCKSVEPPANRYHLTLYILFSSLSQTHWLNLFFAPNERYSAALVQNHRQNDNFEYFFFIFG